MENLLTQHIYEGETTEDETALVEEMAGSIGREPQDSPPGSDTRPGGGHGADFIQAGCKEGLGGCTS